MLLLALGEPAGSAGGELVAESSGGATTQLPLFARHGPPRDAAGRRIHANLNVMTLPIGASTRRGCSGPHGTRHALPARS